MNSCLETGSKKMGAKIPKVVKKKISDLQIEWDLWKRKNCQKWCRLLDTFRIGDAELKLGILKGNKVVAIKWKINNRLVFNIFLFTDKKESTVIWVK